MPSSSYLQSPLSTLEPSPDSPMQELPDSPLSTLSPQSSYETDDARVKYSWSGGTSTINPNESNEFGTEVTVVNAMGHEDEGETQDMASLEPMHHGATPRAGRTQETSSLEAMYGVAPRSGRTQDTSSHEFMYGATPRAGTRSRACEATPKAGTANRHSTPSPMRSSSRSSGEHHRTPPAPIVTERASAAWDASKTISFPEAQAQQEKKKKKESQHHHQKSQSSFSGIWDFMSAIGLSRSESFADDEDGAAEQCVGNGEELLSESKENDLFAMEVGLMFSNDEGDTINDPSTLYSKNFSSSFTIESEISARHSPAYDLAKYLKYRRDNGFGPSSFEEYENKNNEASVAKTQTADESTIYTAGQSTVRDDHGNQIPENAKMILGYDDAMRRKGKKPGKNKKERKEQKKNIFPTVQKGGDNTPAEMERRLRELAGQISSDWRGSEFMPPALARRLRDFQFAREKRRKKYGKTKPWGILGLYDHLSGVKLDVEWAEDAAWRRQNMQPYLTWADYEAEKNAGFNRPFFTFLVVSACTAMMFTSFLVNDWKFEPLSVNPMIGPSAETLLTLGAKDSYLIVMQQEIWRLVSPMVLHAGLIHYVINMFALWFVGRAIEQIHGFFPAVIQFVVPAIGGTILSAIFLPEYITVGASGGIFGLIGACISDIIMNWNLLFNEFVNERGARLSHARVLLVLFLDIVINCLVGLTPFVDNFTHLGGMIYGFLCGLSTIQLVSPRFFGDERQMFHKCKLLFFRSFGLLICMAGIIASSVVLFSGDGDTNPCTSCTYMSCVSFPPWVEKDEKWWYCDTCNQASASGTLDTSTGKFIQLNINCPNGSTETVDMNPTWPQDELGLESILPNLCREHCLW